jgi:hypothetical protein
MSLPSFRNSNGSPAADAAFMNIVLMSALYANDIRPFNAVAQAYGGTVRLFQVTPTTYEPDVGVITSDSDVLVVMAGTTTSPQLLGHAGGSLLAVPDPEIPVTGIGVAQVNGSFAVGADLIIPVIYNSLPTLRVQNFRVSGHSYGGAVAHILARRLANAAISPANIELMTFGQPRTFDARTAVHEPDYYARIINWDGRGPRRDENVGVDPVCTSPPAVIQLARLGFLSKFLQKWAGFFWQHHGAPYILEDAAMAAAEPLPFFAESVPFVNLAQFLVNLPGLPLHYQWAYTAKVELAWLNSGQSPQLTFLQPYASLYSNGTPLPELLGPPLTAGQLNSSYFDPSNTPVIPAEIAQWEVVSAAGTYEPSITSALGSSNMTIMKGTMAFNTAQGGFSESLYSADPLDSLLTMMSKMQGAMQKRCRLFVGNDLPGYERMNPVIPQFVRATDSLLKRVGIVQSESTTRPSFFNGQPVSTPVTAGAPGTQNLDNQLGWRIVWNSGASRQSAAQCLHGVPIQSFSVVNQVATAYPAYPTAFLREARPNANWLAFLADYTNYLYLNKLGFRVIVGDWNSNDGSPTSMSTPSAVYYNAAMQMVELQWAGVPPTWGSNILPGPASASYVAQKPPNWPTVGSRFRIQVRGWKGFQVMNGRWSAVVVAPQTSPTAYAFAVRILRTCRQPTVSNMPQVSPIAWDIWFPGQFTIGNSNSGLTSQNVVLASNFAFIESKKLGRNFEEQRGRIRNRPT